MTVLLLVLLFVYFIWIMRLYPRKMYLRDPSQQTTLPAASLKPISQIKP